MKRINYIYGIALFLAFALASCDKNSEELFNGNGNEDVNAPEGYVKVSFPGIDDATTRAAISGSANRIGHLQYLLYKKQGADYILEDGYPKIVFEGKRNENTDWPYKQKVYTWLPKNEEYKVVFLGNVDKSMFTNQPTNDLLQNVAVGSKYEEARINIPDNGGFDGFNMYYLCSQAFDTKESTTNGATMMNVDILLQRIVSRNIIKKESTGNGSTAFDSKAYFESLLQEGKPLGDKLLFGSDSYFASNLYDQFLSYFVYPIMYIMKQDQGEGVYWDTETFNYKTEMDNWYKTVDPDSRYENWNELKAILDGGELNKPANGDIFRSDYTRDFIVGLYSRDATIYQKIIQSICKAEGYPADKNKGFEQLQEAIAQSLATQTTNSNQLSELSPWTQYTNVKVKLGVIPQSTDFDLNVTYSDVESNEQTFGLTNGASEGEDNYVSFITLGDKTESANTRKFNLSGLTMSVSGKDYPVPLPKEGFQVSPFLANLSTVHTLKIKDITFRNESMIKDKTKAISVFFDMKKCILDAYFNGNMPEENYDNPLYVKYTHLTGASDYVLHAVTGTMEERKNPNHATAKEYWTLTFNPLKFVDPDFKVTYEWSY